MKNSKSNNGILIVVVVLALIAVFFVMFMGTNYDWFKRYFPDDDLPYGTSVMKEILEIEKAEIGFYNVVDTLHQSLDSLDLNRQSNYVYIGDRIYWNSDEFKYMMNYVREGNDAFIFSRAFHGPLLDSLMYTEETLQRTENGNYMMLMPDLIDRDIDTTIFMNLNYGSVVFQTDVECNYVIENEPRNYSWNYFQESILPGEGCEISTLGILDGYKSNFIKVDMGSGSFYLHTTPLAFTNYALQKEESFEYIAHVFRNMNDGPVIWDDWSRLPHENRTQTYSESSRSGSKYEHSDGPFAFILSRQSLYFAWLTLMIGTVLFFLFGVRRKQRMVPVVKLKENTSIDYANTIGQLYLNQKDHRKVFDLKMNLFRSFLRERYQIKTNSINDENIKEISIKSDVPEGLISDIFYRYKNSKNGRSENRHLVDFHALIDKFHQECK